jgi:flagellar FliJ protein
MAARFRFRLESLLRVRRALEDEAKRNLARLIAARDKALARLADLREAHRRTVEERRTGVRQVVDLDLWRATERWILVLERRIVQQAQEVKAAEARVAEGRQAFVKAHRDHLILVRLKERRQAQHDQEVLQAELKDLDELAMLRHAYARTTPSVA